MKKVKTKSVAVKRDKLIEKGYDHFLSGVVSLLEDARRSTAKAVNSVMTATYWEIGRRIVEVEERSGNRSEIYGKEIVEKLSSDLTERFGKGFGRRNLFQMKAFFQAFSDTKIVQAVPAQSFAQQFPLSWTHYVSLLSVEKHEARQFYQNEALRGGWSYRQLERQINSQFYERTALSKNKVGMLTKGSKSLGADHVSPEEEIKDPMVLEFLGLKDEYSESDLEEALIHHLESFLLELGGAFTFVGRQKRLRIGDEWYRVDLVFFHRKLRCLVLIDLKIGKFGHADAGQMHLYLNYAREHWTHKDENPPVGLILCARKNETVAKYALEGMPNKILAAQYKTVLPQEKKLVAELEKTAKFLERKTSKKVKSKK